SNGVHTLPAARFVARLVRRVSFRLCRTQGSGRSFLVGPSPPRAPLLRWRYPPSSLLRAHAQIPIPHSSVSRVVALSVGSLPLAPSTAGHRDRPALGLLLCAGVLRPLRRRLVECSRPVLPRRHRPSPHYAWLG